MSTEIKFDHATLDRVLAKVINHSYGTVQELNKDMPIIEYLQERQLVEYYDGGTEFQPSVIPTQFASFFLRNGGFSSEHRLAKAERRSARAEILTIISLIVTLGTQIAPAILALLRDHGIEL